MKCNTQMQYTIINNKLTNMYNLYFSEKSNDFILTIWTLNIFEQVDQGAIFVDRFNTLFQLGQAMEAYRIATNFKADQELFNLCLN